MPEKAPDKNQNKNKIQLNKFCNFRLINCIKYDIVFEEYKNLNEKNININTSYFHLFFKV